ncbi:hypothetical protein CCZ01_09000 [Helicobacter monodelphidis]|uniref:hypothetical protein n=1 Tax=Helicobacter sp. 15-1451 TaxID=2004995 RepID=UPI000DCC7575|nr:hypothetical protein [Helicobacter sp. 15-1451]RAX56606.1 hypothetical protein CCZ01_09000 [Helicobacter sp. 15-1451]
MKIEFKKISKTPKSFEVAQEKMTLKGQLWHKQGALFELQATLSGEVLLICDRSGEEYIRGVDEEVHFFISDGLFAPKEGEEMLEVVEFFEGFVDISSILEGEIELIRAEYHVNDE